MSQKVKIELNRAGITQLLRSDEVADFIAGAADVLQERCGSGYGTDRYMVSGRALSSVFTDDASAARENLENNTLLKAVQPI